MLGTIDFLAYGKFLENGTKHSTTKIVTDDKLKKYQRKKTLKSWRLLDNEAEEGDLLELDLEKTKIMDSLPVHIGNSILMHSKLHFLRFDLFFQWFVHYF